MTLKMQTAHPRQLHVENKARYFLQTTGFQKFLRGAEEFNRVFDLREETKGTPSRKVASAVVMGAAVSAMHYTGMASASFVPSTVAASLSHAASVSSLGNAGIVIVTLIVLGAAVLTSAVGRRFASQSAELERDRELAAINEALR